MPASTTKAVPTASGCQNTLYLPRRVIDEDIVITGMSGRFPNCANIEEYRQKLVDNVDMVDDAPARWQTGLYGLPERMGKMKEETVVQFDANFFGVHHKQVECMDPQMRLLLEATHEAIIDAGYNPAMFRGSNTGVYMGMHSSECEQFWISNPDRINGYGLTGCTCSMFANRVSYTFDFRGPSYCIDTACSSSMYALEQAFSDIRTGKCDAAIVGGSHMCLNPGMSLQFFKLKMINSDGKCKVFNEDADGYVRSEALVVIFLQRASKARRVYATILNARTNSDGYTENGITYPDSVMQNRLMRETYAEIGLDPLQTSYVEAHGTGTKVGDPEEVNSICDFFCAQRKQPLLIGSVKSNMGHSESASGLCGIVKVLLSMEMGLIPANIHYTKPNPALHGLFDGRLEVVAKNRPWSGGIVSLNSFGFGGANAHVILKSNPKQKVLKANVERPSLVLCSGRTAEAVQQLLNDASAHADDEEYLGMLNTIHATPIVGHDYRGYAVLSKGDMLQCEVLELSEAQRPIWFIYSGMGSQWARMAKDLMQLDVFSKSIARCCAALRPEGVDLMDILLHSSEQTFEQILNSFVGIAAMQVALTDVLLALGIQPNGMVGHSVGELGCAYADGCFTAEQMVLAAYWRGKSVVDTELPSGRMAAVGLSWEMAQQRLPSDVFAVCHNSADNCTISGPVAAVDAIIAQLNAEGIFAKAVNSSGYAFHSKYIAQAGPKLLKSLERIIPQPKERSKRWISTSVPESAWHTPIVKHCSAAYHVNNLLSPVLFHEGLLHVPKNAIAIEIAPTGLLQAIVKRVLSKQTLNVSLMKRNHKDNMEFLLSNVGKLYAAGAQPQVQQLMGPINFPVSRGTPMLSSKIGWDHTQSWFYPKFQLAATMGQVYVDIDLSNEEEAYLSGHTIDGRMLYPATGYLLLAWKTFAKTRGVQFHKLPVVMENVVFERATILHKDSAVRLGINYCEGSGRFEISENGSLVVCGRITVPEHIEHEELQLEPLQFSVAHKPLNANDIYKELRLRGYDYTGLFRGIESADGIAQSAQLQWADNWVSFMDAMLQLGIINTRLRELYLPTSIERVVINPTKHLALVDSIAAALTDETERLTVPAYVYEELSVVKSGGVEIRGIKTALTQRRPNTQSEPTLERYCFLPYHNTEELQENSALDRETQALAIALQLVVENSEGAVKLKVVEVADGMSAAACVKAKTLLELIEGEPTMTAEVSVATANDNEAAIAAALGESAVQVVARNIMQEAVEQHCHLLYARDILARPDRCALQHCIASIREQGFLLFDETLQGYRKHGAEALAASGCVVVSEQRLNETRVLVLARRAVDLAARKASIVLVTEQHFDWLADLQKALAQATQQQQYVYIVSQGEPRFGALGLINCVRYEEGGKYARLVFVPEADAEPFDLQSPCYAPQLRKDLLTNVLRGKAWGSYRHLRVPAQLAKLQMPNGYMNALVKGDLSSFSWVESAPSETFTAQRNEHMELCHVYYAPINFRDVMVVSGKLAADALPPSTAGDECILGIEFAGRDASGRRIMAMVLSKGIATTCYTDKRMIWDIPAHWSMEEASTVPTVYSTVYYALFVRGQLQKGETILIHAGSGGVGLAAIGVALHHGATVFTTVSSAEKRAYLLQRFPQLNAAYIGNSRSTSFEQLIMRQTHGKGVDVVLNSLADDKLQASVRCLAMNGRFLEIGKYDLSKNSPLGMSVFLKNTAYHGILLDSVMERDKEIFKTIAALVQEGIRNGAVRPLPTTVFSDEQVEQAFRFMASGKHIGKVVIKIRDEEPGCTVCVPRARLVEALPRTFLHASKCYVIVGGLGGFGLELCNWLVLRGARQLVLTSRTGIRSGYQALMMRRWQERGVRVLIDTHDVTTASGCVKLLENANALAPVGGIFNLAVVLRDALLEDQSIEAFKNVCDAKVLGTKHLDHHSRSMCSALDYFVCFSSVSCGRGNIGQTNYGLANSAMERICELRQAAGYPGTAIQWGAVGDTGLVIEQLGNNETVIGGTLPQRMASCLQTLDMFLHQPHAVLASMVVAEKRKTEAVGGVQLIAAIANIMGLRDVKNIKPTATLTELGMDSLMGTEIKQTLERNFDIVLSPNDIRQLTLAKLQEIDSNNAVVGISKSAVPIEKQLQMVFGKELLPSEPIIRMISAAPLESAKQPIFFISPMDGFATSLEKLAARLDRPVYALQCTGCAPLDSLEDLASFYLQHIRIVQLRGPYTIVGYSYGCLVAYIMAIDLEQSKEITELLFLDGSPEFINWYTANYIERLSGANNDHHTDAYMLGYFAMMLGNLNINSVAQELLDLQTKEQKIAKLADMLATKTKHPKDLLAQTARMFCSKIYLGESYRAKAKLKIPVTLIKAAENTAKIMHDYGLSKIFEKEVTVITVPGNHSSFLLDESALNEIVAVIPHPSA